MTINHSLATQRPATEQRFTMSMTKQQLAALMFAHGTEEAKFRLPSGLEVIFQGADRESGSGRSFNVRASHWTPGIGTRACSVYVTTID